MAGAFGAWARPRVGCGRGGEDGVRIAEAKIDATSASRAGEGLPALWQPEPRINECLIYKNLRKFEAVHADDQALSVLPSGCLRSGKHDSCKNSCHNFILFRF
jgi:hypothetical protein